MHLNKLKNVKKIKRLDYKLFEHECSKYANKP